MLTVLSLTNTKMTWNRCNLKWYFYAISMGDELLLYLLHFCSKNRCLYCTSLVWKFQKKYNIAGIWQVYSWLLRCVLRLARHRGGLVLPGLEVGLSVSLLGIRITRSDCSSNETLSSSRLLLLRAFFSRRAYLLAGPKRWSVNLTYQAADCTWIM